MPARRGEVPFVAVPLGRLVDPRECLDLADDLKIHPAQALGYLVLWDAFILKYGDAMTGRVRDYTARHIARELGHRGSPATLIAALKRARVLATQKGTFSNPNWRESITGQYAARKAEDRADWTRQKAAQRAAARAAALAAAGSVPPDVHQVSTRTEGGRPPGVQVENGQKERKDNAGHLPPAPPQGGGELASLRWEWVRENAKRPDNPQGCAKFLAAIPEGDWPLAQWVLSGAPGRAPRSSSRKTRVLERTAYQILSKSDHLQFRDDWRAKLREEQRPKNGHARPPAAPPDDVAAESSRKASALAFVLEQLADGDVTEAKKAKVRAQYEQTHGPLPVDPPLPSEPSRN